MDTKKGLTLIELVIVIVFLVILAGVTVYVFRAIVLTWSSQETRAGIDISLDVDIEGMVRDLREATAVSSAHADEIRFTSGGTDYIYYFYNELDPYPPSFADPTLLYELRKTTPIDDMTLNGIGTIILTDVASPPTSHLSINGSMVDIDLSVTRGDETIRSRTTVRPRNI